MKNYIFIYCKMLLISIFRYFGKVIVKDVLVSSKYETDLGKIWYGSFVLNFVDPFGFFLVVFCNSTP
jgi:hypothetical protein